MVGNVRFERLKPKKPRTTLRMKNAKKAITNPTIAAVIVCRALSTFALSPPEVIHLIPPKIRKKRDITAAITRIKVTAFPMIEPRLFAFKLQRVFSVVAPLAHGSTLLPPPAAAPPPPPNPPAAKTDVVIAKYAAPVSNVPRTFFIS